jgi:flavorubredoxin
MKKSPSSISLVERKKYDRDKAHQIASGIWWVGFFDGETNESQNTYLVVDEGEAVLINPGSRVEEHHKTILNKVSTIIDLQQIQHIVVLHCDPARCASLPLFEKLADRNVRIYAPSQTSNSVKHYGCTQPIIVLDDGDSIIFRSGRTIDYFDTPHLQTHGSGILNDSTTNTTFTWDIFGDINDEWNLFATPRGWEYLRPANQQELGSKKAYLHALNKIERLSPERICPQTGPIIEEDVDKYIAAARDIGANE